MQENRFVLNVDSNRELCARHGVHFNLKEQIAGKVVTVIKDIFYVNIGKPLVMKWTEAEDKDSEKNPNHQLQAVQGIKDRRNVSTGTNEEEGRRKNEDQKRSKKVPTQNEDTSALSKDCDD